MTAGSSYPRLAERWALLAPHVRWTWPQGEGPFPTALLFHGCGGPRAYLDRYGAELARAGIASASIDSFAPRGWSRARALAMVCTGLDFHGGERAGDVLAAVWGVSREVRVDPQRLALAGWSHGGWAIMDLMTMALDAPGEAGLSDPDPGLLQGVRALALAYPYCGPGALTAARSWRRRPEVFAFVGEADQIARPGACRRAFRRIEGDGVRLETWFPPQATHAFDEDDNRISPFRFDPSLTREAEERVTRFLADRLAAFVPS